MYSAVCLSESFKIEIFLNDYLLIHKEKWLPNLEQELFIQVSYIILKMNVKQVQYRNLQIMM